MVRVCLVGNVEPQTSTVLRSLQAAHGIEPPLWVKWNDTPLDTWQRYIRPDLIIVAGWRHLIPQSVLAIPRLGTVGFHSAKLPEYPGRAPVPWALLRGDAETENTMLFLDEGVDSGDIIDRRVIPIWQYDSPSRIYGEMARTCVEMLEAHFPALLTGTAPRMPQDMSKRGPLTTKDGWDRLAERERLATGHA